MSKTLAAWQTKFDALSLRERLMVAAAALAAVFLLADALLLGGCRIGRRATPMPWPARAYGKSSRR